MLQRLLQILLRGLRAATLRLHPGAARAPRGGFHGRTVLLGLCVLLLLPGCHLFRRSAAPDPLAPEMVRIEGGRLQMGDVFAGENEDAMPVHEVHVRSFRLARYEVTFAQYDAFAQATGRPLPDDGGHGRGLRAVTHVTWDEAVAFCAHHGYRLPTEAEWEYAARGGERDDLYAGTSNVEELADFAFYGGAAPGHTMPVGMKRPNVFGLYDLSGNASEWVGAFYANYPAPGERPLYKDLTRPGLRITRGGNFLPSADYPRPSQITRTYWRAGSLNDTRSSAIGFRCAGD